MSQTIFFRSETYSVKCRGLETLISIFLFFWNICILKPDSFVGLKLILDFAFRVFKSGEDVQSADADKALDSALDC